MSWTAGMAKMYPVVQSPADGACSLIFAGFGSNVNSGDFFMPSESIQNCTMGMPVKCMIDGQVNESAPEWILTKWESEKLTIDPVNHDLLWSASEAAVGETFSV